jgi:flagellar protein FlbD
MILLTRLNHTVLVLNSDLIETIETAPDTVVSLVTGQKLIVLETPEEIMDRVVQFRRNVLAHQIPVLRRQNSEQGYPASAFIRPHEVSSIREHRKEQS